MSKLRKILIICLSVCCVALSLVALAACGDSSDYKKSNVADDGRYDKNNPNGDLPFYYPDGSDPTQYEDPNNTYIIHTTSLGGLAIDGVKITVSKNGVTIVEGRSSGGGVRFGLPESEYDLSYSDLPNGYFEDEANTLYSLSEEHEVTTAFNSAVIKTTAPGSFYYDLGDVMYDFSVTDTSGNTVVLSDLVAKKRLVVINLWYTTCSWCLKEFPAINNAYNLYKDSVEIVALATPAQDSPTSVRNFKNTFTYEDNSSGDKVNRSLDFILAYDSAGVIEHFNITGYPTSIFVDRYGVIAFAEPQAQTSPNVWIEHFAKFTADDYKQNTEGSINGGEDASTAATPPPSDISPLPSDEELTYALLDQSMFPGGSSAYAYTLPLSFRGPNPDIKEEADDAYRSWPFHTGEDSEGSYICPSNTGDNTNNTFSILYTSVELEANQTLSVEIKLNTETNNDVLLIYMNRSTDNYYEGSGNSGGWTVVDLYTATRYIKIDLIIMYVKNMKVTEDGEFVGLRNLKVSSIDENSPNALDVRTEVSKEVGGVMTYNNIYLGKDGFYRVNITGNESNDPLLLVDVLNETLWSDRHISRYSLVSYDGYTRINSVYNLCYWLFNGSVESDQDDDSINNNLVFGDMKEYSSVIIDSYYIQSGSISLVPVSAKVKAALERFVEVAAKQDELKDYYDGVNTSDTWLELCCYYRTVGQGDHNAENHTCLATTNTGLGKILEYAIELELGKNSVTSTDYTMKNRLGGLFYKFTANDAGVYKFESLYEGAEDEGDPLDPKIVIWGSVDADPYNGSVPIAEADETLSATRMKTSTTNFKLYIYLKAGQTIYPQLTTSSADYPGLYDFEITYEGESHYELQIATTGEGMWSYYVVEGEDDYSSLYYISVSTIYDNSDDRYYHRVGDEKGSVMYIDFLMSNFFDQNGNSLIEAIRRGAFDFSDSLGLDYTNDILQYYYEAIDKEEDNPTYGMVEADKYLVTLVTTFANIFGAGDETVESGIWKAFAYYWEYYGPEEEGWVDLPENWQDIH